MVERDLSHIFSDAGTYATRGRERQRQGDGEGGEEAVEGSAAECNPRCGLKGWFLLTGIGKGSWVRMFGSDMVVWRNSVEKDDLMIEIIRWAVKVNAAAWP